MPHKGCLLQLYLKLPEARFAHSIEVPLSVKIGLAEARPRGQESICYPVR